MKQTKVLILGAGGAIAHHVIQFLQHHGNIHLTLFLRNKSHLKGIKGPNINIVEGDVLHHKQLNEAMKDQDIVYANLAGSLDKMARQIVEAMEKNGVRRLIFVTSLGIYNEVPGAFGKWNDSMIGNSLAPYREAADIIETSDLDYTVVRPAWLTDNEEVDYELTQKGEDFKGTEVSRKSVAAYIADLIQHPRKNIKASVGIDKPGTEGDKPSFY
ncbi:SDR family oxidoreductase [Chitinophaga flava]|uniref:NAD-dependent dehydratase n=1 Tax=Chitinophaga flava TaxID=2259036 RepID=A0A365XP52_9BACT|nr:SDR family oxidoreductase [Chitinophaga flava]RBL88112.1 NAD-dependent dehydratase [Chitinophaga flava]